MLTKADKSGTKFMTVHRLVAYSFLPKATPEQVKAHSRVLTPEMRPEGISDKVAKEGFS